MPGISGLETLQLLLQDCPSTAVIMLTVSEDAEDLGAALQHGARGYLLKNIDADYLVRAIHRAKRGESVIAESMTSKLIAQLKNAGQRTEFRSEIDKLTPREKEILGCLARGDSNKLIARTLNVADSTVKIHVQNILKKLSLTSRVQAAIFAVGHGISGQ
jgi:two-component system nitrate/nitrite response regulator NarL